MEPRLAHSRAKVERGINGVPVSLLLSGTRSGSDSVSHVRGLELPLPHRGCGASEDATVDEDDDPFMWCLGVVKLPLPRKRQGLWEGCTLATVRDQPRRMGAAVTGSAGVRSRLVS